jgi:hypothetical protein
MNKLNVFHSVWIICTLALFFNMTIKNEFPSLVKGDCLSYSSKGDELTSATFINYQQVLEVGDDDYIVQRYAYEDKVAYGLPTTESIPYVERNLGNYFHKINCSELVKTSEEWLKNKRIKMKNEIIQSKEYQNAKETCLRNLDGAYNVQALRYALIGLQTSCGDVGVALLVNEVPEINKIVAVPEHILKIKE